MDERSSFDHGIACLVRGDEHHFRETDVTCRKVPLLSNNGEIAFEHLPEEELVSDVIEIEGELEVWSSYILHM